MFNDGESAPVSIAAIEDYPSIRIVRLRGPIDHATVAEIERFRVWVMKHPGFKRKHILLDFKQVTNINSAAVAGIIQAVAELKSNHFRLGAIHVNEFFSDMFRVLMVHKWITLYKDESEALEGLK